MAVTMKQAFEIGYEDGYTAASESGSNEAPQDGWDGWTINAIGGDEMARLLGYRRTTGGFSKAALAKLAAYARGAQAGADQAIEDLPLEDVAG